MQRVLGRTPPWDTYEHQPYTLEELDTHVDRRIWATILWLSQQLDFDYQSAYDEGYDRGFSDAEEEYAD